MMFWLTDRTIIKSKICVFFFFFALKISGGGGGGNCPPAPPPPAAYGLDQHDGKLSCIDHVSVIVIWTDLSPFQNIVTNLKLDEDFRNWNYGSHCLD